MNPIEKLEYFSFHIKTKKYANRKVVQFKQAKKIIRELSKELPMRKQESSEHTYEQGRLYGIFQTEKELKDLQGAYNIAIGEINLLRCKLGYDKEGLISPISQKNGNKK